MDSSVYEDAYSWDMNKSNKKQSLAYGWWHMHLMIFVIPFFKMYLTFKSSKNLKTEI